MNWRHPTSWIAGLALLAGSALVPDAASNLESTWVFVQAAVSLGFVVVHVFVKRRGILEFALGVALALAWSAGPRQGVSGTLAVLGLAAVVAAYFTFKLEARMHEDQEVTPEGRVRTHEAVAFASRRIIVVCLLAAGVAWVLFHVLVLTAGWVSARWEVSIDATSVGPVGAVVAAFLLGLTGWRLLRLGRAGRTKTGEDDA